MSQRILFSAAVLITAALTLLTACPKPASPPAQAPPAVSHARPANTPSSAKPSVPPAAPVPPEQPAAKAPAEKPVAPEKNPPGDIPDTQVFITYSSSAGMYSLKAPEGWARSESGAGVKFADKFDGEQVILSKCTAAPTVESVKKDQVAALMKSGRAVKVLEVNSKKMPGGVTAVYIAYTSNSDPDPVTNKQVRLDNVTYYYFMPGKLAALTLWAPQGADNVDQWKLISESFKWQK